MHPVDLRKDEVRAVEQPKRRPGRRTCGRRRVGMLKWPWYFKVEIIGRHVHLISDKTANYDTSERQKRDKMAWTIESDSAAHSRLPAAMGERAGWGTECPRPAGGRVVSVRPLCQPLAIKIDGGGRCRISADIMMSGWQCEAPADRRCRTTAFGAAPNTDGGHGELERFARRQR